MRNLLIAVTAAFVLAICGVGWAQHAGHGPGLPDEAALHKMVKEMIPTAKDAASTRAFKEAHIKMMHAMHIQYTGRADVDFVRGMIAHHQGAIDMAEIQLQHGKDPELHKLSREIIRAQKEEIAQMQAWLAKNAK